MNNLISKFNLYEYFRILLPGAYLTFLVYIAFKDSFDARIGQLHWSNSVLLIIVASLILGSFIYSLDLPRIFKKSINFLPTNLMEINYPDVYTPSNDREIEHIYYSWYEQSDNKSKNKTEILSGLYHFNINFAACSILGIIIGLFILCSKSDGFILYLNLAILFFSALSAFTIVKCRLRFQWQRNFWQFEEDNH